MKNNRRSKPFLRKVSCKLKKTLHQNKDELIDVRIAIMKFYKLTIILAMITQSVLFQKESCL